MFEMGLTDELWGNQAKDLQPLILKMDVENRILFQWPMQLLYLNAYKKKNHQ